MDTTSPLFLALLANGPIKMDGYTYFLYGGKIRKCKSKRGPRKSRTEGERQTTDRFTETRKMWKIYRRAIKDLPIWRVEAGQEGSLKVIPDSTPSMAGAYNRVKEYGHSKRFGSPWDLWMLP